jgi:hypothetical protein
LARIPISVPTNWIWVWDSESVAISQENEKQSRNVPVTPKFEGSLLGNEGGRNFTVLQQ